MLMEKLLGRFAPYSRQPGTKRIVPAHRSAKKRCARCAQGFVRHEEFFDEKE